MNEDFVIPRTAANARLLARVAATCDTFDLDPALAAMAEDGKVTEEEFDALPAKVCKVGRTALQLLLDLRLRAVVPNVHPAYRRPLPLLAAKLSGLSPVIAVSNTPSLWQTAADQLEMKIEAVDFAQAADTAWQKGRRDGVLLMEYGSGITQSDTLTFMSALAREWPRTIVWGDPELDLSRPQSAFALRGQERPQSRTRHWSECAGVSNMAAILRPMLANTFLANQPILRRDELPKRGFKSSPAAVAFLFGVVAPSE